jgi:hypothetical protein
MSLLLGGCALFDDPPDRACTKDADCFQAQGETCNLATKECEVVEPDAGAAQDPADEVDELATEVER